MHCDRCQQGIVNWDKDRPAPAQMLATAKEKAQEWKDMPLVNQRIHLNHLRIENPVLWSLTRHEMRKLGAEV